MGNCSSSSENDFSVANTRNFHHKNGNTNNYSSSDQEVHNTNNNIENEVKRTDKNNRIASSPENSILRHEQDNNKENKYCPQTSNESDATITNKEDIPSSNKNQNDQDTTRSPLSTLMMIPIDGGSVNKTTMITSTNNNMIPNTAATSSEISSTYRDQPQLKADNNLMKTSSCISTNNNNNNNQYRSNININNIRMSSTNVSASDNNENAGGMTTMMMMTTSKASMASDVHQHHHHSSSMNAPNKAVGASSILVNMILQPPSCDNINNNNNNRQSDDNVSQSGDEAGTTILLKKAHSSSRIQPPCELQVSGLVQNTNNHNIVINVDDCKNNPLRLGSCSPSAVTGDRGLKFTESQTPRPTGDVYQQQTSSVNNINNTTNNIDNGDDRLSVGQVQHQMHSIRLGVSAASQNSPSGLTIVSNTDYNVKREISDVPSQSNNNNNPEIVLSSAFLNSQNQRQEHQFQGRQFSPRNEDVDNNNNNVCNFHQQLDDIRTGMIVPPSQISILQGNNDNLIFGDCVDSSGNTASTTATTNTNNNNNNSTQNKARCSNVSISNNNRVNDESEVNQNNNNNTKMNGNNNDVAVEGNTTATTKLHSTKSLSGSCRGDSTDSSIRERKEKREQQRDSSSSSRDDDDDDNSNNETKKQQQKEQASAPYTEFRYLGVDDDDDDDDDVFSLGPLGGAIGAALQEEKRRLAFQRSLAIYAQSQQQPPQNQTQSGSCSKTAKPVFSPKNHHLAGDNMHRPNPSQGSATGSCDNSNIFSSGFKKPSALIKKHNNNNNPNGETAPFLSRPVGIVEGMIFNSCMSNYAADVSGASDFPVANPFLRTGGKPSAQNDDDDCTAAYHSVRTDLTSCGMGSVGRFSLQNQRSPNAPVLEPPAGGLHSERLGLLSVGDQSTNYNYVHTQSGDGSRESNQQPRLGGTDTTDTHEPPHLPGSVMHGTATTSAMNRSFTSGNLNNHAEHHQNQNHNNSNNAKQNHYNSSSGKHHPVIVFDDSDKNNHNNSNNLPLVAGRQLLFEPVEMPHLSDKPKKDKYNNTMMFIMRSKSANGDDDVADDFGGTNDKHRSINNNSININNNPSQGTFLGVVVQRSGGPGRAGNWRSGLGRDDAAAAGSKLHGTPNNNNNNGVFDMSINSSPPPLTAGMTNNPNRSDATPNGDSVCASNFVSVFSMSVGQHPVPGMIVVVHGAEATSDGGRFHHQHQNSLLHREAFLRNSASGNAPIK